MLFKCLECCSNVISANLHYHRVSHWVISALLLHFATLTHTHTHAHNCKRFTLTQTTASGSDSFHNRTACALTSMSIKPLTSRWENVRRQLQAVFKHNISARFLHQPSRRLLAFTVRLHLLAVTTLPACELINFTSLVGRCYAGSALNVCRFNIGLLYRIVSAVSEWYPWSITSL